MFKLLARNKTIPADLLASKLYDEESFYRAFIHDIRSSELFDESTPGVSCNCLSVPVNCTLLLSAGANTSSTVKSLLQRWTFRFGPSTT